MVETVLDYLDRKNTSTKYRTHRSQSIYSNGARYDVTGKVISSYKETSSLGWHQQTDSIEHPWYAYRYHHRLPRNVGGPFITTKLTLETPGFQALNLKRFGSSGTWVNYEHEGHLFPHLDVQRIAKAIDADTIRSNSVWKQADQMNVTDLQAIGEKIMLSVVPTSAAANAVVALGEPISDGALFGLPGRALIDGDVGGEYLNTVFGILPTLGDLESFNTAVETYDKVIKQYRRDANKLIRRRAGPYLQPEEESTSVISGVPVTVGGTALTALLMSGPSTCTIKTRITRKVWYAGAFKYHIPKNLSSFESNILDWQRAFHILPSPSDVWELLPFSWLADWFTNGGDSLRHLFLQSSEGATQVYGYVMCQSEVQKTYVWSGALLVDNIPRPYTLSAAVVKTIKQRVRVTPFGIHFRGVDLTPRQLAIMAALGIAH